MPGAIFDPFDVVVTPYPFTDRAAPRRRPALVVSSPFFNERHEEVILAILTTAGGPAWPSDVPLKDWRGAGLSAPCRVRARFFSLDRGLILRRLGGLASADRRAVGALMSTSFAFG